ncbi:N-acetyl-gamma-glutamyl-phosphate reductase [Helicobacter ibis]|uniref:N-acetyl-gamma-glutamyl-phosphate reductase n=1 Tax=Helicobacter ibis TaxID=2962633 RepID=A0ABT4VCY6_9HELI|nr:N-acetyl-gamma-glutamyl-phosphate reductase [Helicobacter ibis]MDA3968564.1 N-acetyl-gamma-glutamyl-phosphate reductase [Helicobacter ibis]
MKIKTSIVGVGGYTGLELVKMLLNHEIFKISSIYGTEECELDKIHTCLNCVYKKNIEIGDINKISQESELVFLALPHTQGIEYVSKLYNSGVKIVDLSADYRLSHNKYEKYYQTHSDKNNIDNAVYGLIEYNREKIKTTNLVANPGCYPTATLLALLPFLPFLDLSHSIFIDAKSSVSGAGKKLAYNSHFVNINENIFAYSPISHRHSPEIEEQIFKITNKNVSIMFVPHLIPITRGMLISIYARLKEDIDPIMLLKDSYKNEKFIRIRENCVQVKNVAGTHFCDIYATKEGSNIFINSCIDNLLRGASSQAIANANLMFNLKEDLALPKIAYAP